MLYTFMLVDSHCHLEMEAYDADREQVIGRSKKAGVRHILTVATEEKYFAKALEILDAHAMVYGAFGIHPHNSADFSDFLSEKLRSCFTHRKVVAYGEIGLDFYRNYAPRDIQIQAFTAQIALAKSLALPIIVHSRDAKDATLTILDETAAAANGAVMHCFSYDLKTATRLLDMGFYLSVPGTITYKNASELRDIVRHAPLERILPETDAPFLTPEPHRGRRNEPGFVSIVVKKIAEAAQRPFDDVSSVLYNNFVELFMHRRNAS